MAGDRKDPFHGYNFLVEIDGVTKAGFREASGLDSGQDPVDYRNGDEKQLNVRKLPGLIKYSNISLKRGITDDKDLWEWRKKVMDGKVERKNVSIILLSDDFQEKLRWNMREAWPSKWTGPSFNATSNDVAIEALEFVHEGLVKA